MTKRLEAVLLLGPTGSGKTPLGQLLELRGFVGRQCVHFDFGEHLRRVVAAGPADDVVSTSEHTFLANVLATGSLLEDKDFPIAEKILGAFLRAANAQPNPLVILNGLPRHAGQAAAVDRLINIQLVVELRCSADVVAARIATNQGGDRTGRDDDHGSDIRRKLEIFKQRTAPLVRFLAERGARTIKLDVTNTMTPDEAWNQLQRAT